MGERQHARFYTRIILSAKTAPVDGLCRNAQNLRRFLFLDGSRRTPVVILSRSVSSGHGVCECVRACVCACVRACVRVCNTENTQCNTENTCFMSHRRPVWPGHDSAILRMLTRQPLGLRATRQPLGGGGIKLPPLLLRPYRRNAKR